MALGKLFAEECFDFKGVGVEAELWLTGQPKATKSATTE